MRRKSNLIGYLVMLLPLVLVILLISGVGSTDNKQRQYYSLIKEIQEGKIDKGCIQGNQFYWTQKGSDNSNYFPDRYDYHTVIGGDFYDTVTKLTAEKMGKRPDEVSAADYGFDLYYRAVENNEFVTIWLPTLVPCALIIVLYMMLVRSQNASSNKAMNFGKSKAQLVDPAHNKTTFADVAGAKEEKEELAEIVDFLKDPKKYIDLGAHIPTGVLMVGPPGTGKTLLAKAVAGEAKVPFFSIDGSSFVEMFVGMGASRVRDLFEQAKRRAPAIIFIDEIDAVGRHRGAGLGGGHDEREQTLNQLLVEMDGFTTNEGIIVLAATNRRDILDPALLRPGRFDRQVTVNYPDMEGRVEILKVHSKGKPLAEGVDLENIAKRTPYATGADLRNIMNEAAIQAVRRQSTTIEQNDIIEAVERIQMGPEKKSHKVLQEDRVITAYHEAGHAVVGHYLPKCDDVHMITVVPRGQAGGFTLALPEKEFDHSGREELRQKVAMLLAGRAAESITQQDICTGAVSDLKRATEIVRSMVTKFGMSEELGLMYLGSDQEVFVGMEFGQSREYSDATAAKIDQNVKQILDDCYKMAADVLTEHADALHKVANLLIEKETVDRKAFLECLGEEEKSERMKSING